MPQFLDQATFNLFCSFVLRLTCSMVAHLQVILTLKANNREGYGDYYCFALRYICLRLFRCETNLHNKLPLLVTIYHKYYHQILFQRSHDIVSIKSKIFT